MILDERFRKLAHDQYHEEGEIEIDDNAPVSRGDDEARGAYVQAWVWVELPDDDEERTS